MSCFFAPIALRNPISRVRSVTVVSIMFMMPMPPTTSEIAAIAARSVVNVPVTLDAVETMLAWFSTVKSACVRICDIVPLKQERRNVVLHLRHRLLGRCLNINFRQICAASQKIVLVGRERHIDHVILITEPTPSFCNRHADHRKNIPVDPDLLTDRHIRRRARIDARCKEVL